MPSGDSHSLKVSKCCSASISVGAMSATWQSCSAARTAANAATTVLPAPTSPCNRRIIGLPPAMSFSTSAVTRACARVRRKPSCRNSRRPSWRRGGSGTAAAARAPLAAAFHHEVVAHQLVQDDARPRRRHRLGVRRWRVQEAHGVEQCREVAGLARPVRRLRARRRAVAGGEQRVDAERGGVATCQRRLHPHRQTARDQPLGHPVHRREFRRRGGAALRHATGIRGCTISKPCGPARTSPKHRIHPPDWRIWRCRAPKWNRRTLRTP